MLGPQLKAELLSEGTEPVPSIMKEVLLPVPAGAATQVRWSAALDPTAEAITHLRVGAGILLAVQFLNIAADIYAKPGFAARFANLHLLNGALLAILFALTWTELLKRHWRPCALLACTILIATGTWMSVTSHDVLPRFVGVLIFALGCATFLPWGGFYQAALNGLCLLSFAIDARYVGGLPREGTYLWIGIFTALIVAQFVAIYSERYRHALVMSAEELAQRDAAIESSRLKSLFLATVSHEMRTPLHVIQTYAVVLENQLRKASGNSRNNAVRGIQRAARRLQQIVDHTLDFSRLEAGEFQVRPISIDVVAEVRGLVDRFRQLAEENGLTLWFDTSMPKAILTFDEYCLKQTISNLLENAIKFTERGSIAVKLSRDDQWVCLEVRDTGVGIDADFLPRIFEPFSQEQAEYAKRFTGAGLGLALVKRYLDLNHASITVTSDKGAGTSVLIRFASDS